MAEYFRKKRGEEKVDVDMKRGQTTDQEQRYVKYMAQLEDLRNEVRRRRRGKSECGHETRTDDGPRAKIRQIHGTTRGSQE